METPQKKLDFDRPPVKEKAIKKDALDPSSRVSLYSFSMDDALRELKDIRQEAEEAYALDNQIDPVPESAYNDALSLFEMLFARDIPMPDIGWAEDGSLGLEWRPAGGIATMGLYGDNLVIYTAFFGENRQVEGVCAFSDSTMLMGFLMMLYPPLIGT